jgi:hypothetical protein
MLIHSVDYIWSLLYNFFTISFPIPFLLYNSSMSLVDYVQSLISVVIVQLTMSQLYQAGINQVYSFSNHLGTVTTVMVSTKLQFQTGWNQSNLNNINMNTINQSMPSVLQETVFYILTTIIYSKWKQIWHKSCNRCDSKFATSLNHSILDKTTRGFNW